MSHGKLGLFRRSPSLEIMLMNPLTRTATPSALSHVKGINLARGNILSSDTIRPQSQWNTIQ